MRKSTNALLKAKFAITSFLLLIFTTYITSERYDVELVIVRGALIGATLYGLMIAIFQKWNYYVFLMYALTVGVFMFVLGILYSVYYYLGELNWQTQEDGVFENMSALFLFIASLVFVATTVRYINRRNSLRAVTAFIFALIFFVIGMEEVSWLQRIASIDSPEFFLENNLQQELNLHNLHSVFSNILYSFGAFILLIVMPFLGSRLKRILRNAKIKDLQIFIPSIFLLVPFSVTAGFLFPESHMEGLMGLILTVIFALTISILIIQAIRFHRGNMNAWSFLCICAVTVTVSIAAVSYSVKVDYASNTLYELREFFIALGILVFSVDTYSRGFGLARDKSVRPRQSEALTGERTEKTR